MGKLTAIGERGTTDLPRLAAKGCTVEMSDRRRSYPSPRAVVRDRRRRSWVVVCPTAEFVVGAIDEQRAQLAAVLPVRPNPAPRPDANRFNGTDAFALTLIAGFYGSLLYCLASVVRY